MEQIKVTKELADELVEANAVITLSENSESAFLLSPSGVTISGSGAPCTKTGCGVSKGVEAYPYVYAIGKVTTRFPSLGIEKELLQATGRAGKETIGLTDQKAFHKVLSDRPSTSEAVISCKVEGTKI